MPRAEMLARMSAVELDEWMAYAAIEPFGEERADMRMGILASVIANANRAPNRRPFEPSEFIPDFAAEPPKPLTEDELARIQEWKAMARAQRKKTA